MDKPKVAPNFDEPTESKSEVQTQKETKKTFTSQKLDIINCMLIDPRISANQFKVAFCLIQHTNVETGAIFPSQERISVLTNLSISAVKRNIKALVKAGWLLKQRKNRQHSNSYAFSTKHVNAMLDRRESLEETMREQRALANPDRSLMTPQEILTGQKRHFLTGHQRHFPTGHQRPPNTLREHLKVTPEVSKGIEQGNLSSDTREASAKKEIINE